MCYLAGKKKLQHGDMATRAALSGILLQMADIILPLVSELLLYVLCLFLLDLDFPASPPSSLLCPWLRLP